MVPLIWIGLAFVWLGLGGAGMVLLWKRPRWRFFWQGAVALGLASLVLAWLRGDLVLSGLRGLMGAYLFLSFLLAWGQSVRLGLGDVFPLLAALPAGLSLVFVAWAPSFRPLPALGTWHALHLACMGAAFASLSLVWSSACIVHLQLRILQDKRFGFWWDRLPSLQALDAAVYSSLQLSFLAFGGMFVTGLLRRGGLSLSAWSPRLLAGGGLWLVVGLVMHARAVKGISARRLAWGSLMLFVVTAAVALYLLMASHVPVRW